jgi:hypothetical protein
MIYLNCSVKDSLRDSYAIERRENEGEKGQMATGADNSVRDSAVVWCLPFFRRVTRLVIRVLSFWLHRITIFLQSPRSVRMVKVHDRTIDLDLCRRLILERRVPLMVPCNQLRVLHRRHPRGFLKRSERNLKPHAYS